MSVLRSKYTLSFTLTNGCSHLLFYYSFATSDVIGWFLSRYHLNASDPCTRLLDGYKVKMTGKNCPNYTIKEEMHGQLCKNWGKNTDMQLSNPCYDSVAMRLHHSDTVLAEVPVCVDYCLQTGLWRR